MATGMPRGELTRERVLLFIARFWRERQFGPTTREIADGVGLASNSTVALHLRSLREDGLVWWAAHPDGKTIARSVRLTPIAQAAIREHWR